MVIVKTKEGVFHYANWEWDLAWIIQFLLGLLLGYLIGH